MMNNLPIADKRGLGRLVLGSMAATLFALEAHFLPFGNFHVHILAAAPFLSDEAMAMLCAVSAFLISGCVFLFMFQKGRGSIVITAVQSLFTIFLGWFLSPLLAAFPPAALFLCRINGSERLYFPRSYSSASKTICKLPVCLEDLLSMAEVFALDYILLHEFLLQSHSINADGAVLWLFLGVPAIVLLYVWRTLNSRGSIETKAMVCNIIFRCGWYIGWLLVFLMALFSYLPAVIIS